MQGTHLGSTAEGEVYVNDGQLYYTKPVITSKDIFDISQNNYIVEPRSRNQSLIFTDEPEIHVYNTITGERDEQTEKILTEVASAHEVNMWVRMQQVWVDIFNWGAAFMNPVWEMQGLNGRRVLTALRRLPPESFTQEAPSYASADVRPEILRGVVLAKNLETEEQELQLFQTDSDGTQKLLDNVCMIQDPRDTRLAGTSRILPMVPVVKMINFSWTAEMQKVNRVGAPLGIGKFLESATTRPTVKTGTNRDTDDIQHMKNIGESWGKGTFHMLKPHMSLEFPSIPESASAMEAIDALSKRINDYFSPARMLDKDGASIGGNAISQFKLIVNWIKSEHSIIEIPFTMWLQEYLDTNGYTNRRVEIDIPEPQPDMTEINRQRALDGYSTQTLNRDERRILLDHEELDEAGKIEIEKEFEVDVFGVGFDEQGFKDDHECQDEDKEIQNKRKERKVETPGEGKLKKELEEDDEKLLADLAEGVKKNNKEPKKKKKEEEEEEDEEE